MFVAGLAAFAAVAGPGSAQAADISGTVEFAGGAVIPEGGITLHLEIPEADALHEVPPLAVVSDGKAKAVDFSFAQSAGPDAAAGARIVARLEREDGWLLARGSAQVEPGTPVQIVLHTVMY
jgi:hypothetical protein